MALVTCANLWLCFTCSVVVHVPLVSTGADYSPGNTAEPMALLMLTHTLFNNTQQTCMTIVQMTSTKYIAA